MIDVKTYLESGIIEEYCLGLASREEASQFMELCKEYPNITLYLQKTEAAIKLYFSFFQKQNSRTSKKIIRQRILENEAWEHAQLEGEEKQLKQYISISRNTDIAKVQAAIKALQPPAEYDNVAAHSLYNKDGHELTLVWVKEIVPMEEHPHLDESFLVLEGTAECSIDGQIFYMKAGDYMHIPRESHHEVVITSSSPAKAIQSRIIFF